MSTVLRSTRILLVPTKEQEQKFYEFSYYSDRMYNIAIDWEKEQYEEDGTFLNRFALIASLPDYKKKHPEFKKVGSYVLSSAVTDVSKALSNMSKMGSKFPRYKKYGKHNSFGVRSDSLGVYQDSVKIPSIRNKVKCKHCHWLTRGTSNKFLGGIQYHNPHISYDGKYWWLTFGVELEPTPDTDKITDEVIGIDIGIKNTVYLSDGTHEDNINKYDSKEKGKYTGIKRRLYILERRKKLKQRELSRKIETNKKIHGKYVRTNNIKKLQREIAEIYRHQKLIRETYLHEITNKIIKKFPKRIMLEDLKVKNMMKNRHLAKSIQEQNFYRIRQLLIEKALNTQAVQIGVISTYYPSSKKCSKCGKINKDLKLSDRVYICKYCGSVMDRDYNASINIRDCKDYELVDFTDKKLYYRL